MTNTPVPSELCRNLADASDASVSERRAFMHRDVWTLGVAREIAPHLVWDLHVTMDGRAPLLAFRGPPSGPIVGEIVIADLGHWSPKACETLEVRIRGLLGAVLKAPDYKWALTIARKEWPQAEWNLERRGGLGQLLTWGLRAPIGSKLHATNQPIIASNSLLLTDGVTAEMLPGLIRRQREEFWDVTKAISHDQAHDRFEGNCAFGGLHLSGREYSLTGPLSLYGMRRLAQQVLTPQATPRFEPERYGAGEHFEHAFAIGVGESRHGRRAGLG